MRFLVDNAVSPRVSGGLAGAGLDAVHVRTIGLKDASDEQIFDAAAREDRIVVSADTDFGTLLARRASSRPSVILFRGEVTRLPPRQLEFLLANFPHVADDLRSGAVVVFDGFRIRVRRLPLYP